MLDKCVSWMYQIKEGIQGNTKYGVLANHS